MKKHNIFGIDYNYHATLDHIRYLVKRSFFESLWSPLHHLMQRLQSGKHSFYIAFAEVKP